MDKRTMKTAKNLYAMKISTHMVKGIKSYGTVALYLGIMKG